MVDVFISYKSERRKAAAHLAKILECYGYTVWYDYSLVKGRNFAAQIDAKIREAKAVIVLWCSKSVRSEWVADEAALAAKLDRLVPAKIEHCELRVDFDRKDHIDLTGWGGAPRDHALDVLLAALEQKVRRAPQQNFKAICEYEEVWRRFGAPSLKAFALNTPVHADLELRPAPDPPPSRQPDAPAGQDWRRAGKPRFEYWNFTPNSWLLAGALIAAVAGVLVWHILRDGGGSVTSSEPAEPQKAAVEPPPVSLRGGFPEKPAEPPTAVDDSVSLRASGGPSEKPQKLPTAADEPVSLRASGGPSEKPPELPTAAVAPPKPAPMPPKAVKDACDGLLVSVAMPGEKPCIEPGSGESFKDCPEMVIVPSGSFTMGSPKSEPERSDDEDQHKVKIEKPFAVGRFAVNFAEWDACVAAGGCNGYKPNDEGWGRGDRPAINVSWNDAKAYVAWLSKKTGKTYRLLSEAEREYVTRAGTTTPFWWGSSITPEQANYDGKYDYAGGPKGTYGGKTLPVKSFKPNPWGLYQVHGNVWEWVEDCWSGSYSSAPADGSAWTSGSCNSRVWRGGSWIIFPRFLRSAYRLGDDSGH